MKDRLVPALLILTFVTGVVDAVSFLGLGHVFTANMTGNVVLLGFAAVGTKGLSMTGSLASLGAFLAGALAGGQLCAAMKTRERRWLTTAAFMEVILLLAAALAAVGFDAEAATPAARLYALIVLSALAMGVRNATVRQLGVADMTTTVLTLTLTGIAADSSLAGGTNPRLGRRVGSVLLLAAGAAAGAMLLRFGLAVPLLTSALCSAIAAISLVTAIAKEREPA